MLDETQYYIISDYLIFYIPLYIAWGILFILYIIVRFSKPKKPTETQQNPKGFFKTQKTR